MDDDLDRAYVVNGRELSAGLGGESWSFRPDSDDPTGGRLQYPAQVARIVLGNVAKPLDEPENAPAVTADAATARTVHGDPITVEALAQWFRENRTPFRVGLNGHMITAIPGGPEAIAETILEDLTDKAHAMPVDAHICCEHANGPSVDDLTEALRDFSVWITTRSGADRLGVVREPRAAAEGLALALRGRPYRPHSAPETRDPVGVLIDSIRTGTPVLVDEDEPADGTADAEIAAMARILHELDAIEGESGAGYEASERIVRWLADRYGYTVTRREDWHPF